MSAEEPFCETTLADAHYYYLYNIQGYIETPICIIGVIFNIFNILVFTRRNMISPVNLIFTHLAFADLSMLLAYILHVWVTVVAYYRNESYKASTYTAAALYLRSKELINISHHVSVCLIMMLAIWKYIAVFSPSKERQWCNMKTTRNTVMAVYIACVLLAIPLHLSHHVVTYSLDKAGTEYIHVPFDEVDPIAVEISMIIRGLLFDLLPSVVLGISSVRLFVVLRMKKEHPNLSSNVENRTDNVETKQQIKGSVIILIIIVTLCLSFVIPLGLLDLLYVVLTRDKYSIYRPCTNSLLGILSILNCFNKCVTFVVYYTMDQDFRATFKSLFEKCNIFIGKQNYFVLNNMRRNDESSETNGV
ncbi:G-protein coupled receptor dmsr-1-like [Planococcus citri]|uniref:G-protein coupled receptor dmsr-1-like n=1 Tax=Planococcus citri TaxID=170843 RepID=UPI0031F887EE